MEKDYKKNFADNLKKYRVKRGYSQSELADLIGIDRSTISNYENGKREPTMSNLFKFAEVLKVDYLKLIGFGSENFYQSDIYDQTSQLFKSVYLQHVNEEEETIKRINLLNKLLEKLNYRAITILCEIAISFSHNNNYLKKTFLELLSTNDKEESLIPTVDYLVYLNENNLEDTPENKEKYIYECFKKNKSIDFIKNKEEE